MRAKYRPQSFIKNTSLIEDRFLDVNTLPRLTPTLTDEPYTIDAEYDQRPDLLAWKLYNDPNLFWVFPLRNPDVLVDPIRDFTAGTEIILPSTAAVQSLGDTARALIQNGQT